MHDSAYPDGPRLRGRHHDVIQPNRKEHELFLLPFLLKSRLDLVFYPGAFNRVLREHQEQLVVDTNSFINAGSEAIPNFQIFRRKPAADVLALQVGIEVFGEILVFSRVADKTGVVFDGTYDE